MRKTLFFVIFILLSVATFGQTVLRDGQGKYIVLPGQKLEVTGMTIKDGAEAYVDSFAQAVANPGKVVITQETKRLAGVKLFRKIVQTKKEGIVYDSSLNEMALVKLEPEQDEEFSLLSLLFISPILLMALANFLWTKSYGAVAAVLIALSSVVAVISGVCVVSISLVSATVTFAVFIFTSTVAVIAATIIASFLAAVAAGSVATVDVSKKRVYKAVSVTFYILAVVANIMVYV